MALIALLAAVSFTAAPSALVLGKDAGANLEVRAPGATRVAITASLGLVSQVLAEDGVFHARYTPPPHNAPGVALLLATIDGRELRWLSLPLSGSDVLPLETRPHGSRIEQELIEPLRLGSFPLADQGRRQRGAGLRVAFVHREFFFFVDVRRHQIGEFAAVGAAILEQMVEIGLGFDQGRVGQQVVG